MHKGPARILCFDESHAGLKGLVYLLKTQEYHVVPAHDLAAALDIANREALLDLALINLATATDVPLERPPAEGAGSQRSAVYLAEILRKKFPKLPLLFVINERALDQVSQAKAFTNTETLSESYEASYCLFLVKTGLAGGYLLNNL
jgi:hypothetical protein